MPIAAGSKLSFYEVLSPLGAGAMGEVYRALDTRLGREVAIKVLPEHFASDAERMKRFEREARTLASLNHPNVAQIFGVDQHGETFFLALELVPGETLEERLKRGPLPGDEALEVCRQIAEGLEAAHEAGVIHRDLKPANIRITPDGRVKLLDFGLAKPIHSGEAKSSVDSVLSTELGRLIGTPTYMAPEQARGKSIDKRVDLWAFGCVLFESLTAQRAFAGETVSDVLASVLEKEPDWTKLPASTPPHVRALLARCLSKDPRMRLRDAGDARIELERPAAAVRTAAGAHAPAGVLVRALPWAAAVLLGGLWLRTMLADRPPPATGVQSQLALRLPSGVEIDSVGNAEQNQLLAISPDGSRVAFLGREAGVRRIYVRALGSPEITPLAGTEGAICPLFSPDGRWIAFGIRGRLAKIPATGGQPVEVSPLGPDRGGAWGPDGSLVFSPGKTSGLVRIPAAGGEPVELTRPDSAQGERSHRWPTFLPGGDEVAFTIGRIDKPGDYDGADIEAVSISTGKRRKLASGASFVRVLAPDTLVFARSGQLVTLPFEQATGAPLGSGVPVLDSVAGVVASGVMHFDIAANGTLVYAERDPREGEFSLEWIARDGTIEALPLPAREYRTPRISRDGKRIAVAIGPGGGRASDLWIAEPERGSLSRLTFDGRSYSPVWRADDERVAFVTSLGIKYRFAWKRADGSDDSEILVEFGDEFPRFPMSFTADGDGLVFITQGAAGTSQDVFCWSRREGKVDAICATPAGEHYAALSPDGAWLAFVSDESGTREVYVQDFPAHRGRWQVGEGGIAPRWSHDGRELFIVRGQEILAVPVETSPSFSSGAPRTVATLGFIPTDESVANYDVAPDGRLLVVRGTSKESYQGHLNLLLNWRPEVTQARTKQ